MKPEERAGIEQEFHTGSAGGKIGHRFIPKPFKISALLTIIDDVLKEAASKLT